MGLIESSLYTALDAQRSVIELFFPSQVAALSVALFRALNLTTRYVYSKPELEFSFAVATTFIFYYCFSFTYLRFIYYFSFTRLMSFGPTNLETK